MKAQVITQFGGPEVFQFTEIPRPVLQPGHVIIKVCATSVNQIDCKIRRGLVPELAPAFPAVLHGDLAGIVSEVAPDVTGFEVGDEVYGCAGGLKGSSGALAEWMLADAKLLAKKPKSLSMIEAAALPLVGITAWQALFQKGLLTKDKTILVHGGMGGVGHIALQLANGCGARVYTTVRDSADFEQAELFGAHDVINAREEEVADYVKRLTDGKGFDIVFDTVGGPNLDGSLIAAAKNGTVVTIAARSQHDLTPLHTKALSLHAVFMLLPILDNEGRQGHGAILREIANLADLENVKPMVDSHIFSLDTVSDAHTLLESGKARGKVVVKIEGH